MSDFLRSEYFFIFCFYIEEAIEQNRLLAVIQRLSTEWIVSLTVRFENLNPDGTGHCNIIQLTRENSLSQYGDRTPVIFLKPNRDEFYIASAINGNKNLILWTDKGLALNVSTRIEVHQRYTSGGNYRYFIKINGEEVYSIINTNAQQFYNVKVYASNPWSPSACPGYIKNFEVTNFV